LASLSELLHGGVVDADEVTRVRDTVVFEQPNLQTKLIRFYILLTLAAAIAAFGLLADSVAAVIGAMIVAPLMLPIMGLAFAISIGDRSAVAKSLLVAAGGIVAAMFVGYLAGLIMPASFDPEAVTQITLRTSPRLLDLLMALATGLAGAFAIGRRDVSDTLPGVAIAISLVPPLSNAGILFATGRSDLAFGSLLLFVTNYLAILLTGSLVFGIMGYPRVAYVGHSKRGRRIAIAVALVMLVVVAAPLSWASFLVWMTRTSEQAAGTAVEAWLGGSGYEFVSAKAEGGRVNVIIAGSGSVPDRAALASSLRGRIFGQPLRVEAVGAEIFEIQTE